MVKDYGHLLRLDPAYAEKAQWISKITRDPVEVIGAEWTQIAPKVRMDVGPKVAFRSPCSLQHGQKLNGASRKILLALGLLELTPVADPHLCCGSAERIRSAQLCSRAS